MSVDVKTAASLCQVFSVENRVLGPPFGGRGLGGDLAVQEDMSRGLSRPPVAFSVSPAGAAGHRPQKGSPCYASATRPRSRRRPVRGQTISLSQLAGRRVVLFFFPKAFTTGCTIETRQFRDHYSELAGLGAEVIGVSVDKEQVQCDFANKEGVPFPMIGDERRAINRSYDVLWPILNVSQRVTYVIGPDGRIELVLHHGSWSASTSTKSGDTSSNRPRGA